MSDAGPTPWRRTSAVRAGNSARTCASGSAASMARPLAVSEAGSRTPTSVTRLGAPRRALLDHVQDVAAVQHGEVAVLGRGVDEPAEHGAGDPAQRLLARVGGAELEGRDAEAVAALLGQVDDEAAVAQSTASRW